MFRLILLTMLSAVVSLVPPRTMTGLSYRITYSSAFLREIVDIVGKRPIIPTPLFKSLQEHNISRIRPCGNRAGVKIQSKQNASIKVITSCRQEVIRERGSLNLNNLATIKSDCAAKIKVGVVNCCC